MCLRSKIGISSLKQRVLLVQQKDLIVSADGHNYFLSLPLTFEILLWWSCSYQSCPTLLKIRSQNMKPSKMLSHCVLAQTARPNHEANRLSVTRSFRLPKSGKATSYRPQCRHFKRRVLQLAPHYCAHHPSKLKTICKAINTHTHRYTYIYIYKHIYIHIHFDKTPCTQFQAYAAAMITNFANIMLMTQLHFIPPITDTSDHPPSETKLCLDSPQTMQHFHKMGSVFEDPHLYAGLKLHHKPDKALTGRDQESFVCLC